VRDEEVPRRSPEIAVVQIDGRSCSQHGVHELEIGSQSDEFPLDASRTQC